MLTELSAQLLARMEPQAIQFIDPALSEICSFLSAIGLSPEAIKIFTEQLGVL